MSSPTSSSTAGAGAGTDASPSKELLKGCTSSNTDQEEHKEEDKKAISHDKDKDSDLNDDDEPSIPILTPEEKHEVDLQVGRFIYKSNLPVKLLTHYLFQTKNQFTYTYPSYQLPSIQLMKTTILDAIHEEAVQDMHNYFTQQLQRQHEEQMQLMNGSSGSSKLKCTLIQTHCLGIISSFLLIGNSKSYFIDAESIGMQDLTPEVYFDVIYKHLEKLNTDLHDCEIASLIITEIEIVGELQGLMNMNDKTKNIFVIGSQPHAFNKLADNLYYQDQDKEEEMQHLRAIFDAYDTVTQSNSNIADAMNAWIILENKLNHILLNEGLRRKFKEIKEMSIVPSMIAAYMLHPTYKGKGLSKSEQTIGKQFIHDQCTSSNNFLDHESWKNLLMLHPDLKQMKIPETLTDFTNSIITIPCHTYEELEEHFKTSVADITIKNLELFRWEGCKKLYCIFKAFGKIVDGDDDGNEDEADQDEADQDEEDDNNDDEEDEGI